MPRTRVIGRLDELRRRAARHGEQTLADVLPRWSLAGNRDWLADGLQCGEPFLQVSTAAPGSVLAWELAQLRAGGCVRLGPFWLPARWLHDGAHYRRVLRLVAEHVLALPGDGVPVYVPKALAELEPLLAAWPFVVALPATARWSIDDLVLARAWPVHPLGVVAGPRHADGAPRSPGEFFCHDVDHARFKLREDLLARGVDVPDPYVDGGTFDAGRGVHRSVLPALLPHLSAVGWREAPGREARARRWLAAAAALPDALAEAARWLLFELVHEKGLPLDANVLARALATDAHVAKLRRKAAAGFFARRGPGAAAIARLDDARRWWRSRFVAEPT